MTPEERADLKREEARIAALEAERDTARRDLTAAYNVLCEVMPGRPVTVKAAAEKAARMIRDHAAERRRVLDERDDARAERDRLTAFVDKLRDLTYTRGKSGEIAHRRIVAAFADFDHGPESTS